MNIKRIDYDFSVCKVPDYSQVDMEGEYCFIGKTDEEKSLVCITDCVPENVSEHDDGRAVRCRISDSVRMRQMGRGGPQTGGA